MTDLVWHPAPFHSPWRGFGWRLTVIPHSSAIRMRRNLWEGNASVRCTRGGIRAETYLAIQRWSPMSLPGQGPTWNSH